MNTYSLSRRLIVTVLLVETLLALCTTSVALLYMRRQQMQTFDAMLRGRADSLFGAVQDAEDAADSVILSPESIDLKRGDLYQVREPSGRIVGQSPEWNSQIENNFHERDRGSNFRFRGHAYRGIVLRGVRHVDADDRSPGISRPVIIDYAASLKPVRRAMADAARFLLLSNLLVLLLTGITIYYLLRRGMAPLEILAAKAATMGPPSWEFEAPEQALAVKELSVLTRALEAAMCRLGDSLDQQRTFVNDAAHELKTAVTIIKSSLQLLASRPRTLDEYRSSLESCLTDCARLEDLVQKLLMLARLEQSSSGELVSGGHTDLSEALRTIATQLESLAVLRGISLKLFLEDTIEVALPSDECKNLVFNLLLNALQHTPRDGRVTVRAASVEGLVQLDIEDTGEGIDPNDLPFIFNRFYRSDRSRARTSGGTGLGLAICRAIVDAYGGKIEIQSELGNWTRVCVRLQGTAHAAHLQTTVNRNH
jgi:signal transduction histidine kinase